MIIFLFGPDTYRSRQKLNEIIEEYKKVHKNGLSLVFFDCEGNKVSINGLRDITRQASMFKEKKLVVVSNLFNSNIKEDFQKSIKEFSISDDIIVIYGEGIKKTDALFKALEKNSKTQEFKNLEGIKFANWVKKEFEANNTKIDSRALSLFLSYIEEDLWNASNEIKKLSSFKKTLSIADVKLFIKPKIENDIFKTIDAIASKNKKLALSLLYKHLENGDSPIYLFSMMGYQLKNLLIIKDLMEKFKPYNLIIKESGLHPFVVKKTYYQAGRFALNELKKIYQNIFETDLKIKTGQIEPELALELLVAGI